LTEPFRQKRNEILKVRQDYMEQVKASSSSIRKKAQNTLHEVKDLIGLINY
jgi:hypothetical protein